MKRCSKCRVEQALDSFHRHARSKDGRQAYCKPCSKLIKREYFARGGGREKATAAARKWRAENPDRVYAISSRYHKANPEKRERIARGVMLRRGYQIDLQTYDRMFEAQGGVCAICGRPETGRHQSGSLKSLGVDHDHKTGVVRGLLCASCNLGLGKFRDCPDALRAAASYLESHGSPCSSCGSHFPPYCCQEVAA